ncbi:MAG: Fe2+/Zn2+ uptake regulation protein [Rhodospirillales bacterium]|nr:Fe2+/Zn2+ uptake regulation protein [Rhodospirillales bacterium]
MNRMGQNATSTATARPFGPALERLRGVGLRPTRQRLALAKLLFDTHDRHVTAEMLHGEALRARVRVSLATVYNTLHQFTDAGLLREIVVDAERSYFDTNVSNHHHLFDEGTRHLHDIPEADVRFDSLPPLPEGMEVSRVDVIVRIKKV